VMYCCQCGTQMPDDSAFCHKCGAKAVRVERKDAERGAAVSAPPPKAAIRRGYCELCGQELGVNEKMRGLAAHENCRTRVSEAPPRAPAVEGEGPASRVHDGSAAGVSGGPRAEAQSGPRPRRRVARTGFKWLPILGGAVVGGVLVTLYVLVTNPAFVVTSTAGEVTVDYDVALVMMILASAFVAGVTASLWTNWRGGAHGCLSGMIVGFGAELYLMVQGNDALLDYFRSPQSGIVIDVELSSSFILFMTIRLILAVGIGALGGLLGERIRR
jgi:hypothetical protein